MTKFKDPFITADGKTRASVTLKELSTLWFNTGTLCNLTCENCYIESSPKNDSLSYLSEKDITPYLDEIQELQLPTKTIGLTGGEPFLNPHIQEILRAILSRGLEVLVLTNAYRVLDKHRQFLKDQLIKSGELLKLRISLDHYTCDLHEKERGRGTFSKTLETLKWLAEDGHHLSIAGRSLGSEDQSEALQGYSQLMKDCGVGELSSEKLVIFPEMSPMKEVPEITTDCWGILNKTPEQQMCASERMIVKRKGQDSCLVLPCTLLAYDPQFELGTTLASAEETVQLNHPYCAQFCVLGGASCSSAK